MKIARMMTAKPPTTPQTTPTAVATELPLEPELDELPVPVLFAAAAEVLLVLNEGASDTLFVGISVPWVIGGVVVSVIRVPVLDTEGALVVAGLLVELGWLVVCAEVVGLFVVVGCVACVVGVVVGVLSLTVVVGSFLVVACTTEEITESKLDGIGRVSVGVLCKHLARRVRNCDGDAKVGLPCCLTFLQVQVSFWRSPSLEYVD